MFLSLLLELERDGFCQQPLFECLVAEVPEEHKSKEGKALKQAFPTVLFNSCPRNQLCQYIGRHMST